MYSLDTDYTETPEVTDPFSFVCCAPLACSGVGKFSSTEGVSITKSDSWCSPGTGKLMLKTQNRMPLMARPTIKVRL